MLSTKSSQGDGHEKVKGSDKTEDKEDERKEETRGFPAQWIIYIYNLQNNTYLFTWNGICILYSLPLQKVNADYNPLAGFHACEAFPPFSLS